MLCKLIEGQSKYKGRKNKDSKVKNTKPNNDPNPWSGQISLLISKTTKYVRNRAINVLNTITETILL